MLKVFAHLYAETEEKMQTVAGALINEGYEIAYDSPNNATIIKEVPDEQETETT